MRFPRSIAATAAVLSLIAAAPGASDGLLAFESVQLPERIVRTAYGFLGTTYASGGTGSPGAAGFDCSGLVWRTFHDAASMDLPRSVSGLYASGKATEAPLHVGDILFFDTLEGGRKGTPDHVGIYAGAGLFVHAASEGRHRGVTVSSLGEEYYRSRYLGARRLLAWSTPTMEIDVTDASTAMPREDELRARMPAGAPLRLLVTCNRNGGRFVVLTAFRDGVEAFRRRLHAGPDAPGTAVVVPGPGSWVVTVELPGDQELAAVRFEVGE